MVRLAIKLSGQNITGIKSPVKRKTILFGIIGIPRGLPLGSLSNYECDPSNPYDEIFKIVNVQPIVKILTPTRVAKFTFASPVMQ